MRKYGLLCVLLGLLNVAESQFLRTIPPETEAGYCTCQSLPSVLSGISDLFMPHHTNVIYKLFTRSTSGDEGLLIKPGDGPSLAYSGFNPELPLTIIVHGFQETPEDSTWVNHMKDALLTKENMNVIIVDWSRMSRSVSYSLGARYAKYTGKLLANLLHFLKDSYPGFSGNQMHLIGFSMGAHIVGIAGHHFPGVARITGLDPAGPAFECIPDSQRLDRRDAKFVHVIHSNAGCRDTGHIGYRTPTGHQDFYVNGGGKQPGCPSFYLDAIADIATLRSPHVCHHHRAVQYFVESIRSPELPYGYICPNYDTFKLGVCLGNTEGVFGYHATPGPEGAFFLSTQSESTFLSKHFQIQVHVGTRGNRITQGQFILQSTSRNGQINTNIILRSGQRLAQSDFVYSSMITLPLESSPDGMQFALRYEPLGIRLIPGINDYLDVLQIRAVDPVTKETYCLSPRESIQIATPYYVKARRGIC